MADQKNAILAAVLTFLILYLGYIYLGLAKRWIVAIVCAIVISLIVGMIVGSGTMLHYLVSFIVGLYFTYDTYQCANAINENRSIPLLFNVLDV